MTTLLIQAAAGAGPAGGAAIGEIVIATVAALLVTAALLVLGVGHRTGRVALLARAVGPLERISGLPGWAILPSVAATASLLVAVFGMYWDISLHIDVGRDPGPLANPAHYFILFGLFGIFSAGFLAMVLPKERPSPSALRLQAGWDAPLGGVLICACGAFSLIGFPLDDVWHRIFGQDVTLWGPTHLMLIGGAAMTLIGIAVLLVEGLRARPKAGDNEPERSLLDKLRGLSLAGGLLIGLSTFQGEFDFGVPQFRFVFAPMLVMLAASVALVAMRLWLGRGSALGAVAFFLVIRGALALLVGPVLGQSTPHFPLYIVEALLVEAVGLRLGRERPLAFALTAGAGIGTVGLASEWAWSHVWSVIPWPASLIPEGAPLGLGMAVAGALVGAWVATRLASDGISRAPRMRLGAIAGAVMIAAFVGIGLHRTTTPGVRAHVQLAEVRSQPAARTVSATVTLDPPRAASAAKWLTVTAWQGGGLVVDRLQQIGPGRYRTTKPIPVHGNWKALLRLQEGSSLSGIPLYLPDDPAIPARGVPALADFTRTLVADHQILQREQKTSSAGVLTLIAYGVVGAIALGLLVLLAWGLHRVGTLASAGERESSERIVKQRTPARVAPRAQELSR